MATSREHRDRMVARVKALTGVWPDEENPRIKHTGSAMTFAELPKAKKGEFDFFMPMVEHEEVGSTTEDGKKVSDLRVLPDQYGNPIDKPYASCLHEVAYLGEIVGRIDALEIRDRAGNAFTVRAVAGNLDDTGDV